MAKYLDLKFSELPKSKKKALIKSQGSKSAAQQFWSDKRVEKGYKDPSKSPADKIAAKDTFTFDPSFEVSFDGKSYDYRNPANTVTSESGRGGVQPNPNAMEVFAPLYAFSESEVNLAAQRAGIKNINSADEVNRVLAQLTSPSKVATIGETVAETKTKKVPGKKYTGGDPTVGPKTGMDDAIAAQQAKTAELQAQLDTPTTPTTPTTTPTTPTTPTNPFSQFLIGQQYKTGTVGPVPLSPTEKLMFEFQSSLRDLETQQRRQARRAERVRKTELENLERAGALPEFRFGAPSDRNRYGTGGFRRRLQIAPTSSLGLSLAAMRGKPVQGPQMLNI